MSNIRATTISALNGTDPITLTKQSAAKAWMTMAGNGTAIDASLNTSSVTDSGVGQYTQNYTNSFDNDSYSWVGQQENTFSGSAVIIAHVLEGKTASATQIYTYSTSAGANLDTGEVCSIIHGDLA